MKAAICDRCGGMVDPHDTGGGELALHEIDHVDGARRGPREVLGDICKECEVDLKAWLLIKPHRSEIKVPQEKDLPPIADDDTGTTFV